MLTQVQIIPWMLADSNHMPIRMQWLDPRKTVFVGALHGMLNAEGLATIFGDLFGGTTIVTSYEAENAVALYTGGFTVAALPNQA